MIEDHQAIDDGDRGKDTEKCQLDGSPSGHGPARKSANEDTDERQREIEGDLGAEAPHLLQAGDQAVGHVRLQEQELHEPVADPELAVLGEDDHRDDDDDPVGREDSQGTALEVRDGPRG